MTDELILNHEDLSNLHRHYINLTCVDSGEYAKASNGGNPKRYNFSAFVVDVEGVLLAITAGHVFEELRQAVGLGSILSEWAIDDSMVTDHGFPAYPVDVSLEKDILFFHEDGLAYGAYLLDPMAAIALNKSGIVPVRQDQWDAEDLDEFTFWTLIGLPTQFATLSHEGPSLKSHVTVRVVPLTDRPTDLEPTKHPRLFAKVDFESVAGWERWFDVGGMSGGPVFGTREPPQGSDYEYRLIGIQSAWRKGENVAMCAAQPFLRALARMITERRRGGDAAGA